MDARLEEGTIVASLVDDAGEGVIVGSDRRGRPREVIDAASIILVAASLVVVVDVYSFDSIFIETCDTHQGH